MAEKITLAARLREETGKNAMRRLRMNDQIPGVIFGRSGITHSISLESRELEKVIHSETGLNTVFTVDVEGLKKDNNPHVIIKDYQLDPVTHDFLHVSLYRIHMDRLVEVRIPVVAEGVARGVKDQGGTLDHVMREVLVECLPGDIPDAIHVDVSSMEIGDHVRISELGVPKDVKILGDTEAVVLHLSPPRKVEVVAEVEEEEVAEEAEEAEEAETAETKEE